MFYNFARLAVFDGETRIAGRRAGAAAIALAAALAARAGSAPARAAMRGERLDDEAFAALVRDVQPWLDVADRWRRDAETRAGAGRYPGLRRLWKEVSAADELLREFIGAPAAPLIAAAAGVRRRRRRRTR